MVAASGYAVGYNGSYLFDKIGEDYISRGVPYIPMRALPASMGAALVPMVYAILIESGHSRPAAILGASMMLFGMIWSSLIYILKTKFRYQLYFICSQ
jgi:dolichyl-phosphate-mannose-protein mannosyltransferase